MEQAQQYDCHHSLDCSSRISTNSNNPDVVVVRPESDACEMVSERDDVTASSSSNTSSADDDVVVVAVTSSSTTVENGSTVRGRKRVRLAEHHEVVALVEEMNETERDNTWWRQEDFDGTKALVKHMCRELRQERRFSDSLTDAYERACGMNLMEGGGDSGLLNNQSSSPVAVDSVAASSSSCASFSASTTASIAVATSSTQADTEKCSADLLAHQQDEWNTAACDSSTNQGCNFQKSIEGLRNDPDFFNLFHDDGPRGLERLSSRLHAIRRQRHLQEVKHAVFLEQARQNISNQRNSELLARQAEYASRKSRAFANLLGMGDAWAVADSQQSHEDDTAVSSTTPGAAGFSTTVKPLGILVTDGSTASALVGSTASALVGSTTTTTTTTSSLPKDDSNRTNICAVHIGNESSSSSPS